MAAKKKTGRIALPYLITIFLGILIIGGGTYLFLRHLGIISGSSKLPEPPSRQVTTVSYADNHTILFILDEPEQKCSSTFLLMRSVPKDKKLIFMGIPSNTISEGFETENDRQPSLKTYYETYGAGSAVEYAEKVTGVTIDRYMKLNSESFIALCDKIGNVTYSVSEDIQGFDSDGSDMNLTSSQVEKLILYPMFADGETERAYMVGSIASAMVNQNAGQRIADNLDNSFNSIVNIVDTDITAVDYRNHKTAIKNMLTNGRAIASFLILEGEVSGEDFLPSDTFLFDFRNEYYSYDESKDEGKNE